MRDLTQKEIDNKPEQPKSYKLWCDTTFDNSGPGMECYYTELDMEEAVKIAKHFKLI